MVVFCPQHADDRAARRDAGTDAVALTVKTGRTDTVHIPLHLILWIACLTLAACSPMTTAMPPATAAPSATATSGLADTATKAPAVTTPPAATAALLPSASPSRTPTPTPSRTSTATATPSRTPTATPQLSRVDRLLARCPTAAEAAAIDADFKLAFDADPTKGTLVCNVAGGSADLTLLQRRIYETLQVAKLLTFSRPLPWTSEQLYDWLRG